MKCFTADFETTTDEKDCRVWAFALCEIGNPENFIYGNSIEEFMDFCANTKENYKIYFHNIKFDGCFILDYLENNGFEFIPEKKQRDDYTYTTLITDMNVFYSIEVFFKVNKKSHRTNKVTFYDSLKILNFSVEQIAKDFDLPIRKLTLDYKAKREKGHILTPEEIDYIRNDVEIMARALDIMFQQDLKKMTIGSDALNYYKTMQPKFKKLFPSLENEIDNEIRLSYKGGFTYLNPKYKEKKIGKGLVLDVNSEYPAMMHSMNGRLLPVGVPIQFEGEYEYDELYPLYIINISCMFELKKGKIPSIQIKHSLDYQQNEYLESSKGLITDLTLTSVDFELMKENYNIKFLKYNGGYKFQATTGIFDEYIDYWTAQKIQAKKEGNSSLYRIAKLMQNSLYGKFAVSTKSSLKQPMMQDGIVKYIDYKGKDRKSLYCAISSFITSYGRDYIIRSSMKIREWSLNKYGEDYYVYSDTDSIHLRIQDEEDDVNDLKKILEIDDYKLGAWKPESTFKHGAYIRQKCYIEESYEGKLNVVIAGFPKNLAPLMTFDNFKIGFSTEGMTVEDMIKQARKNGASLEEISRIHHKLRYKHVKGGVILEDTGFTLK
ncbi:MAG: hypothetical protein J6S67_21625 [Methanobrevibacter sp.]|nr:hypothetical protein [Methanobrevibacter sp.]